MLEVKNISKRVGGFSIQDVSFRVSAGEYFVLLGVSGAGKTMLLEIIAGLRMPDSGSIFFDGCDITRIRTNKRNIGLVFQDNTVFPHLNVFHNIAYPLSGKGLTKQQISSFVLKWSEMLAIEHLLDRKTTGLSGGELRRVAIARTLAMEPRILLLDEPLSSLDILKQYEMIGLLKKLNIGGQTIIHVTHDSREAYTLANTLTIIDAGKVQQTGSPDMVFARPANRFVAAFAGVRNFYEVKDIKQAGDLFCYTVAEDVNLFSLKPGSGGCSIFIKEDAIHFVVQDEPPAINVFDGLVKDIIPSPDYCTIMIDAGVEFFVRKPDEVIKNERIRPGSKVRIKIQPEFVIAV
jgi:ABC-type sugar transport system ATPase subunit